MKRPIAITMGDPAGIGPEIIVKSILLLKDRLASGALRLVIIGHESALRAAEQLLAVSIAIPLVQEADIASSQSAVIFVAADREEGQINPGVLSPEGGKFAYKAVEKAVDLAQRGLVSGIVTAPLNKEAMNLAGYHYAGHTEMLAELTGMRGSVMMLAHGNMHVSHVTTHVALEDVPKRVTPERIRFVIEKTNDALKRLGIQKPKIAIAALNPHAGENGLFGRQDLDVSAPTIEEARADGFDVYGPVPGDTVFVKLRAGQYDAVVAMYHDQGHIPVKLLGFEIDPKTGRWMSLSGVNITLGLPIIRTSVDHGTAFDIAGKGVASATSMVEAIDYAERLAAGS